MNKLLFSSLILLISCSGASPQIPPAAQGSPAKPEDPVRLRALALWDQMSWEERVGQVLFIGLRPPLYPHTVTQVDVQTREFLQDLKPGGIAFFKGNFVSPEQTQTLNRDLQATQKIPLFLAVDEEGGLVSRLGSTKGLGVRRLPPAKELGAQGPQAVEAAYEALGKEMKLLGLNMNLAPVADGDFVPGNPLGDRAFSQDPRKAALLTAAGVRGLQKAGIAAVIKHFPGLGSVGMDPHLGMPVQKAPWETLVSRDFLPFQAGIAAGAEGIMAAHVEIPGVTAPGLPAGFSRPVLTGVLRDQWKYPGLIISDGLEMAAVTQRWAPGEAAVLALLAGSDMLLLPLNPLKVRSELAAAVESGRIPPQQLKDSVLRILEAKLRRLGPF